MHFSVSTVRRAAVALAVASTTALTATAASAATTAPAHSARTAAIPGCSRADLRFSVSRGSGAAGSSTYLLRFTNRSRRTCYVAGFPGVTAVNRHGRQLGSPAAWVAGVPLRVVNLRPRWTAHAALQVTDVTNFPRRLCRPAMASGLRVIAPNRVLAKFVRLRFLACSRPGLVYLRVMRVQAGRGHL